MPLLFYKILIYIPYATLRETPNEGTSRIECGTEKPDRTMEALESPTVAIAQAIFNDPRWYGIKQNQGIPDEWLFTLRRCWHFQTTCIDMRWLSFLRHLLPLILQGDRGDRDAAWSVFMAR